MSLEFLSFDRPAGVPSDRGSVVTVGTFDGVHGGHWAVLQEVRRRAEAGGHRALLVTFDPHPLQILRPESAPRLLTTPTEKKEILAESGLDYVVFLPFTPALSRYSPRRFVEEILIGRMRMAELVMGHDHGFGRGRSGDTATLAELGSELGFPVDVVPAVVLEGTPISSTRIRRALEEGDVRSAAAGLRRPYALHAPVVRGQGRGRSLGFATANLQVDAAQKLLPLEGIYAVRAAFRGGLRDGVLHLGPRPTFRGSPPSVELHLFDWEGELYGERVRVDFCARLRDVHRFGTVAELVDAIRGDCEAARRVLSSGPSACQDTEAPLALKA